MEIEINYAGPFTRGQIKAIAAAHPELGEKLAAAAYLSGSINPSAHKRVDKRTRTDIDASSVWRLNQRKPIPREGTKAWAVVTELAKQFGKEEFFYLNVREAAKANDPWDTSTPANLKRDRFIIPA